MICERFKPEHFAEIELQDRHQVARQFLDKSGLSAMATAGPAYIARDPNGVILCAAGLDETEAEYSFLWSILSRHARAHLLALSRGAERLISIASRPVVYATTEADFAPGCRWLGMLKFTYMPGMFLTGPDGAQHRIYSRAAR